MEKNNTTKIIEIISELNKEIIIQQQYYTPSKNLNAPKKP